MFDGSRQWFSTGYCIGAQNSPTGFCAPMVRAADEGCSGCDSVRFHGNLARCPKLAPTGFWTSRGSCWAGIRAGDCIVGAQSLLTSAMRFHTVSYSLLLDIRQMFDVG